MATIYKFPVRTSSAAVHLAPPHPRLLNVGGRLCGALAVFIAAERVKSPDERNEWALQGAIDLLLGLAGERWSIRLVSKAKI